MIVGRGGAFLLAGVPTVLHVRGGRAARRPDRAHHAPGARRPRQRPPAVQRIDRERAGFIRAIYRRAWDDPAAFDATYDTSLLDPGAISDAIGAHLAERDRGDHEAARQLIDLRLAAARVRAALCTDPHLRLPTLEVVAEDQGILVRGVLHHPQEQARIRGAADAEAGGGRSATTCATAEGAATVCPA